MKKQKQQIGRVRIAGWVIAAVTALSAGPAMAQFVTSGQVVGNVTDPSGQPLAGATVSLTSPDRTSPRTATTNAEGRYTLVDVDPASYDAEVRLENYTSPPAVNVRVRVGSIQRLNFEIATTTEIREEVAVTAQASPIETVSSQVNRYVSRDEIDKLPLQNRTFLDVLKTVPGVATGQATGTTTSAGPSNSFNIHGARSNQNNFLIDGVSNNDRSDLNADELASVETRNGPRAASGGGLGGATFQTGTALQTFNLDAIEEVQVSTSLFSAEYGNGSGGVINVITRSGSNRIHGSVTVQRQSDGLVNQGNSGPGGEPKTPQEFTRNQFSAALGGAITPDKTHYFVTYERDEHDLGFDFNESAVAVGPFLRGLGLTQNKTRRNRFTGKLTREISDSNNLSFSTNYVDETASTLQSIFRAYVEDLVPEDHANESWGSSLRDVAVLNSSTTLESLVGYTKVDRSFDAKFDAPRQLRLFFDAGALIFNAIGTSSPDADSAITTWQWKERLSWVKGKHSLRAGVGADYFQQRTRQKPFTSISHGFGTFDVLPTNPGCCSGLLASDIEASVTTVHAFVQDDFFVSPRVTVNLGGRIDHEDLVSETTFEPRVGVAFDPRGDGRSVLRAGAGLYHDRVNLIGHIGALRPGFLQGIPDPQTLLIIPSGPASERIVDPALKLPTIFKWVLGYERQLGDRSTVGLHVSGSENDDLFYTDSLNRPLFVGGDRPDPTRSAINIYTNSGFSDVIDVELDYRRTFANGSLVQASYTYEDTNGNSSFDFLSGNSPVNNNSQYDGTSQASEIVNGPLDFEVEHAIKVSAVGQLPLGFQLSGFFQWHTGLPFTVYDSFFNILDPSVGANRNGAVYFEGFNSRRLDSFTNLDLRVAKAFQLPGKHGELLVFLDAFNVSDKQNVLQRDGQRKSANRVPLDSVDVRADFLEIERRGAGRSMQIGLKWST